MTSVVIGDKAFRTQAEAKKFFSAMLGKYRIGGRVNSEDDALLRHLIERHPDRDDKIGPGIEGFYTDQDGHGGRCFHIKRIDGTCRNFSFPTCVRGKPSPKRSQVSLALREAVEADKDALKRQLFCQRKRPDNTILCEATGEAITWENTHADHYPTPFDKIAEDFAAAKGVSLKGFATMGRLIPPYGPILADKALAQEFREYHNKVAIIRLISKNYHRRLKRAMWSV